jgi:hypothetical protein
MKRIPFVIDRKQVNRTFYAVGWPPISHWKWPDIAVPSARHFIDRKTVGVNRIPQTNEFDLNGRVARPRGTEYAGWRPRIWWKTEQPVSGTKNSIANVSHQPNDIASQQFWFTEFPAEITIGDRYFSPQIGFVIELSDYALCLDDASENTDGKSTAAKTETKDFVPFCPMPAEKCIYISYVSSESDP